MSRALPAATPVITEVTLADATRVWARIGWLSFGGPTAQIGLMHRVLVEERRWLGDREFVDALGFCMLLPGPEAMQLATYSGWRLHGTRGGLVAGLLFVLPGALVVLVLAATYAAFGHLPLVLAAFRGIQAAVLVLVVEALLRIARRSLGRARQVVVAIASFVAIFAFGVPFPLLVAGAALLGAWWTLPMTTAPAPRPGVPLGATLRTAFTWLAVWVVPLAAVALVFGPGHLLSQLAWFFSKLAMVTFGGAYAVLAYMSQDVVVRHGWLTAGQMLDGLGLAETTPGPLILVTEFVGYLAAHEAHPHAPLGFGLLGAAIALWATFAPCFLWIFTAAPYLTVIGTRPRLQGALAAITATVLGVILNLAVWFGMHVLFGRVDTVRAGPLHVSVPAWATLDPRMLLLAASAALLLLRFHWSVHRVLGVTALAALVLGLR